MVEAVVDELGVDLVDDDPAVVIREHVRQGAQIFTAIGAAGRVRGGAEDDRLGFGRQRCAQHLGVEAKARLLRRLDDHRLGASDADLLGVAHPVRRGDDDLVARIEERHRQVEEGVLRAHRDDHLGGLVPHPASPLARGTHRVDELGHPLGRRVARRALLDRGRRALADVLGRIEVGLAHAEGEHIDPRGLEFARASGDGHRGGGENDIEAATERRHIRVLHARRARINALRHLQAARQLRLDDSSASFDLATSTDA